MIEIVNWYATRKHYADTTSPQRGGYTSMCGKVYAAETVEEDAAYRAKHGLRTKSYDDLPLCKFCEREIGAGA